jgi:serine/threonine protein kinase
MNQNYQIITKIGSGSYGDVFKVKNKKNNKIYAAKIMKNVNKISIEREVKGLYRAQYIDLVPKIYEVISTKENEFIIIQQLIINSPFSLNDYSRIQGYFYDLINIVAEANKKGISHNDIKPANVIFASKNAYLIDWGLSMSLTEIKNCGTRLYKPPEMLLRINHDKRKSDVWAIGATILTILHNSNPFRVAKKLKKEYSGEEKHASAFSDIIQLNFLCKIYGKVDYIKDLVKNIPEGEKISIFADSVEGWSNKKKKCSLEDLIPPHLPFKKLLIQCLTFDMDKRPTAEELVKIVKATHSV